MNAKLSSRPAAHALPVDLADVALIDAPTCAAAGHMSVSWWHEEVRSGRAPSPVIRKVRCTRWRLSEVRAYWIDCATKAPAETEGAATTKARATKASARANAVRDANDVATSSGPHGQAKVTLAPGCQ